ncbi:MAG TPA: winged helix-turn-helix domain-containing protein [Ktedonobacteraceae bacterium]|nr:winged helix-turn-helix domain-containing protein [Ktedonobacteraceae bacterium]
MKRKDRKSLVTKQAVIQMEERLAIPGHRVQHSDAFHLLIVDGVVLNCTPTEYSLLLHLLQQHPHHVSFETLENAIWAHSPTTHPHRALTRHISHLRTKLWPLGLDILCLIDYGYLLHTGQHEHAAALPEGEHAPA